MYIQGFIVAKNRERMVQWAWVARRCSQTPLRCFQTPLRCFQTPLLLFFTCLAPWDFKNKKIKNENSQGNNENDRNEQEKLGHTEEIIQISFVAESCVATENALATSPLQQNLLQGRPRQQVVSSIQSTAQRIHIYISEGRTFRYIRTHIILYFFPKNNFGLSRSPQHHFRGIFNAKA
jgi:hypothetical protein